MSQSQSKSPRFLSPAPDVRVPCRRPNPPPRSLDSTTASDGPMRRRQSNPPPPPVEFPNAGPIPRHRRRKGSSASVSEKMRKAKRGRDDFTRTIHGCKTEWVSGCFPVDSTQDVWVGLSDVLKSYLSRSVASIALRDGDTILFSCSGIAMERQGYNHRFLTTAGLVRAMNDTNKDYDDLEIEVRHESHKVFEGCLAEFDLHRNFAVVAVSRLNDVQFGPFQHALETLPHGEVLVAVGRDVSGKIRAKCVELNGEGISEDDEDLHCKTSEVWEGGPLLFAEHVVGMNLFLTTRRAIFRPWDIILKHLDHYSQSKCLKAYTFGAKPLGEKSITYPHTENAPVNQAELETTPEPVSDVAHFENQGEPETVYGYFYPADGGGGQE